MIHLDKKNKRAILTMHLLYDLDYRVYWNQGIRKNESLINIGNFSSVYCQSNGWVDVLTRRISSVSKKQE